MKATYFRAKIYDKGYAWEVDAVTTRDIEDLVTLIKYMMWEELTHYKGVKLTKVTEAVWHSEAEPKVMWSVNVDIWTPIEEVTTEMVEYSYFVKDWFAQVEHPEFDEELITQYNEIRQTIMDNPAFRHIFPVYQETYEVKL